jgi:hypothetical protein
MVGSNELYLAQKQTERTERRHDGMTEFDWMIVGKEAVRLHIPVTNRYHLRQIAGILRRYAEEIDFASRQQNLPERELLLSIKLKTKIATRDIKEVCEMTGKGNVRRPYRDI